jgi:hypothetical protein
MNCTCYDHRPGVSGDLIGGGIEGSGPLVLFSAPQAKDTRSSDLLIDDAQPSGTVVLSAASNFMAASQTFEHGVLSYGVMGAVKSIPPGYTLETLISLHAPQSIAGGGSSGVNGAMQSWGEVLLRKFGVKAREDHRRDLAVRKLGYSTDNVRGSPLSSVARAMSIATVPTSLRSVGTPSENNVHGCCAGGRLLLQNTDEQERGADADGCAGVRR